MYHSRKPLGEHVRQYLDVIERFLIGTLFLAFLGSGTAMAEPGSREHKPSRFVDRLELRPLLEDEALSVDEGPPSS